MIYVSVKYFFEIRNAINPFTRTHNLFLEKLFQLLFIIINVEENHIATGFIAKNIFYHYKD